VARIAAGRWWRYGAAAGLETGIAGMQLAVQIGVGFARPRTGQVVNILSSTIFAPVTATLFVFVCGVQRILYFGTCAQAVSDCDPDADLCGRCPAFRSDAEHCNHRYVFIGIVWRDKRRWRGKCSEWRRSSTVAAWAGQWYMTADGAVILRRIHEWIGILFGADGSRPPQLMRAPSTNLMELHHFLRHHRPQYSFFIAFPADFPRSVARLHLPTINVNGNVSIPFEWSSFAPRRAEEEWARAAARALYETAKASDQTAAAAAVAVTARLLALVARTLGHPPMASQQPRLQVFVPPAVEAQLPALSLVALGASTAGRRWRARGCAEPWSPACGCERGSANVTVPKFGAGDEVDAGTL